MKNRSRETKNRGGPVLRPCRRWHEVSFEERAFTSRRGGKNLRDRCANYAPCAVRTADCCYPSFRYFSKLISSEWTRFRNGRVLRILGKAQEVGGACQNGCSLSVLIRDSNRTRWKCYKENLQPLIYDSNEFIFNRRKDFFSNNKQ